MNILNRIIVVLGVIVLVLFALLVIVLAWAYSGESIDQIEKFVGFLRDHDTDGTKVVITLIGAAVVLVGLALLIVELMPPRDRTVAVRDVGMGTAVLSTVAVGRRVEQMVLELPQVENVRAKVAGRRKGVEVSLQVMVDAESDLSAVASEVSRITQETITEQMNVALVKPPHLRLYYSYREPAAPRAPIPAPAEPQPPARARRPKRVAPTEEGVATAEEPPAAEAEQAPPKEEGPPGSGDSGSADRP